MGLTLVDSIAQNGVKGFNFGMNASSDFYSVVKRIEQVLLQKEKENENIEDLEPPLRILMKELTTSWS